MLRFATGQPVGGDNQLVVDTAVQTLVGLPPVLVLTLVIVLPAHGGALPLWAVAAAGTARVCSPTLHGCCAGASTSRGPADELWRQPRPRTRGRNTSSTISTSTSSGTDGTPRIAYSARSSIIGTVATR